MIYEDGVVDDEGMAGEELEGLGPLEAEVMRAAWGSLSPLSVRAMVDQLNGQRRRPLAYTTVMTVMARLADKGLLRRERDGRGFLYEPAVSDVAELAVHRVVREYGDAAVARFVAEARAQPALLERLRTLLDDAPDGGES